MKPARQSAIFDRFPVLFERRHLPMTETCMCWGLDVGDGWADIVERLAATLDAIRIESEPDLRVEQTKQKFGILRTYTHDIYDLTHPVTMAIREAESESVRTCEFCGANGKTYSQNKWLSTMCTDCKTERETR